MTYQWNNQEATYSLQGRVQGNQVSFYGENQNTKQTKAYLNPHMVKYEFIGRSLSAVQGGNKIHVNPNFRGNGLNNMSHKNHQNLNKTVHLNSQNIFMSKPGTSKMENTISNLSNKNENLVSQAIQHQSSFRKVNAISLEGNNKSLYSWSKNKLESNLSTSVRPKINPGKLNAVKMVNHNFNQNLFTYVSPKKIIQACNQTCQPNSNHSIYKTKTKIINESKMKLIHNVSPKPKFNFKDRRIQLLKKQLSLSRFSDNKNKQSSISRVASAVKFKYKYLSNPEQFKKSRYKIDKRKKLTDTVKKRSSSNKIKVKGIRKLFPNYFYNKLKLYSYNAYNVNASHASLKSSHMWRKDQTSSAAEKIINNKFPNHRVIKIGGILYKSTVNKLILAGKTGENSSKKPVANALKEKKKHVVYVRGEKFILENNGRALRRQSENVTSEKVFLTPKRIDIGGVTYIQKSQNVLIRTNVHHARQLVNKAKNKSIALLANLHKRSSLPCMIYHRFGICNRHTKGLCMYKHDPKNISVCKKFLKGNCTNDNCLLSHQVVQEKMATCHFFLNGLCVRENCPFLHVKLNKKAAICENFIQGFCNLGKDCSKRHLHQCPEFDKTGTCNSGDKCPYPHKKFSEDENPSLSEDSDKTHGKIETLQYYVHSGIQKKQKNAKRSAMKVKESSVRKVQKRGRNENLSLNINNQSSDVIKCFPKRVKLDKLPCFIPLNSDS